LLADTFFHGGDLLDLSFPQVELYFGPGPSFGARTFHLSYHSISLSMLSVP
jgi:hypothetical protein